MKEFKVMIGIVGIAIVIWLVGLVGMLDNRYDRQGTVIDIENETATILDTTGNEWQYSNADLELGQEVILHMDAQTTLSFIKDDVILSIENAE